jgi:hypothetical protein
MKPVATIVFALACAGAALAPLMHRPTPTGAGAVGFPGWPVQFQGAPLTQLPLSPIEESFGQNFPGRVARFTDGRREIILRWIAGATRKLHPAADCFKANGYVVTALPISVNNGQRWSGFTAVRGTQTFEVSERIHDATGAQWSDASSWYWAVQLGQSRGPWWAVTVARSAAQ